MNLIFLGPPGSGKGTQSSKLAERFDINIISTGNILREEISNSSQNGKLAESYIKEGALVPDEIVIEIIKNKINNLNNFLLDGFPRNINQAVELDKMLTTIKKNIDLVVNFDVSDDILIKRITGRFICKECKEVYNEFFKKTKIDNRCDKCNSIYFEKRSDDNEKTLRKRLNVFHESNDILCDYYKKNNLLISISALQSEDFIFNKIVNHLKVFL